MADVNAIAAAALEQALAGEDAEDALATALRAAKLENDDRARVAKWVLGSSCLRATLRHWLRAPNAGAAELIDAYQRFVETHAPPDVPWPEHRVERLSVRGVAASRGSPSFGIESWASRARAHSRSP